MKPETLEALLLDRALGELTPESAALLEAYLELRPDLAARADAIQATTSLARAALAPAAPASVAGGRPVAPVPPWRSPVRVGARWTGEVLKLAACVMLGGTLVWLARQPGAEGVVPSVSAVRTATIVSPLRAASWPGAAPQISFDSAASATSAGRYRVRWSSPGNKPQFEEIP